MLQGGGRDLGLKPELECHSSMRRFLATSGDGLTLTGSTQASVFPTENP